jgi:DNA-binding IscR family transcriptional regulator
MTVRVIYHETILGFIARHPNGVFTNDVATRFGMYPDSARKVLKRLEAIGALTSERETAGGSGSFLGAGLVWKVKP